MSLQFQTLFDSVCRCFGHDTPTPGVSGSASQPDAGSHSSVKRRTNRLELKDKQWDELFEKKNKKTPGKSHHSASNSNSKANDLGSAQAVAQAKLAANPTKHRSKRKRSVGSREEIFRSKNVPPVVASSSAPQMSFSRLLNPSLALCFATPIRGTQDEPEETDLRSDNSDTNTLNTCEDTITSTVFFDNKYSHVVETRPPMPLFHQFKIGKDKDEIRNIIATDSHSSVKMIKLLQQQKQKQPPPDPEPMQIQLEDSSSDSDGDRHHRRRVRKDQEMEDLPDVKAVSSSTDSSRQSQAAVHESSS